MPANMNADKLKYGIIISLNNLQKGDIMGDNDTFVDDVYGWEDMLSFDKAYMIAQEAHKNQKRDEGTPYISHINGVIDILRNELQIESDMILSVAAMHDVLEDSDLFTFQYLQDTFGQYIAMGVRLLTKVKGQDEQEYLNNIDKCKELPWLMTIKLADRLNNLRCLKYTNNPEKIKKKCEETRRYYLDFAIKKNEYLYKEIKKNLSILEQGTWYGEQGRDLK